MKLLYLGTAAAEAYPALFCNCQNCRDARAEGGRSLRSRSQALVNGRLLIDYPCDTYLHMLRAGLDLTQVRDCLVTHIHPDHWYPEDLLNLQPGYSHPGEDYPGLTIYGSEDVAASAADLLEPVERLTFRTVAPFEPFEAAGLTVTALKAAHGTPHPYIYLIEEGETALLYTHDTGLLPEESWDYLARAGVRLGLVSLDCTEGNRDKMSHNDHMNLGVCREFRDRLRAVGCLDDRTVCVLNHFSHNAPGSVYTPFTKVAEPEFTVSYEGLEITI